MNKLCINLKDDIYCTDYPHIVSTTFYIQCEELNFPDNQWTDFTYPILNNWAEILIKNKDRSNVQFDLFFEDGPYKLEIVKDNFMQLAIDCINTSSLRACEGAIHCTYIEFISALYEATIFLNRMLFNNKMNKGQFENVFKQSTVSMKELKAILMNYCE